MKTNHEDMMKGFTIASPSDALRDQIMTAARAEWTMHDREAEVFWLYPVLRLAASVAIALSAIGAAGRPGGMSREYSRFFSTPPLTKDVTASELDMPLAVAGLAARIGRIPSRTGDLWAARRHAQLIELLDDSENQAKGIDGVSIRQKHAGALS